jgi:hypothetical protein
MSLQAQRRMDATVNNDTEEEMLYVLGNPDTAQPDEPMVQEDVVKPSGLYRQPVYRTGVFRQK